MKWINIEHMLPELNVPVLTTDGNGLFWVSTRFVTTCKEHKEYFESVISTCCNREYECAQIKYWTYIQFQPERLNETDQLLGNTDQLICESLNTENKESQ